MVTTDSTFYLQILIYWLFIATDFNWSTDILSLNPLEIFEKPDYVHKPAFTRLTKHFNPCIYNLYSLYTYFAAVLS